MFNKGALFRAMLEGIYAQRKLDGDPDIFAPDDRGTLQAIITQGKHAEAVCRANGYIKTIERAKERGHGK